MGIKLRKFASPFALRVIVLGALMLVGGFGIAQQVQAAQTPKKYCDQYPTVNPDSVMRTACTNGILIAEGKGEGSTCQDYALVADQATVDVCQKAMQDRIATKNGAADIVSGDVEEDTGGDTTSPSPTPSPDSGGGSGGGTNGNLQDVLDETDSLSQYIDILHKAGPNADKDLSGASDNEYLKYTDGAGNKQKITMFPSGKENSPAIIFFNGGGWHSNDKNSRKIMMNEKDINDRTQTGPTANQRGYTAFDVPYRYGSSGVYYMFEDVMRGIEHIRNNADMYGIDASKIAIWGDSAGGSLAVRAGASGKSGAKVTAGWSPPTNAYTALFRSYKSLMIGMDHSTCIPTDLAGITNMTDLLNGGSGDVAEYGKGLSSNDFSLLGINGDDVEADPMTTVFQVLMAGQYAYQTGQNIESISKQLEAANSGGKADFNSVMSSGLAGGVINVASKKLIECIDNMNVLSPALFASPDSTPMFLAGFDTDDVVDPNQITGMHDKLQSLGIRSEYKILPGDSSKGTAAFGPNPGNHLDYDARFVCPTLNFLDEIIQPDAGKTDCDTGQTENLGSNGAAGGGSCTARVDSQIRIKSIQSVDLTARAVPGMGEADLRDMGKSQGGDTPSVNDVRSNNKAKKVYKGKPAGGSTTGTGGSGGTGTNNSGSSPQSGGTNPAPLPSNNPAPNVASGGGSGSCGADGAGRGAAGQVNAPAGNASGGAGGLGGLGNLGDLANIGSNLGGGGMGNGAGTGSGGQPASNTPSTPAAATGDDRGGAKFFASKTVGDCQIDYTRAPQAAQGGNAIVDVCNKTRSFIAGQLSDFVHPMPIQYLVVPESFSDEHLKAGACSGGAVAYAMVNIGRSYYCAGHLTNNPNDLGMAVHENVHLTQKTASSRPSWVTEGTADYVRYKYEPNTPGRLSCGAEDTYTRGYTCTAAFFVYVERQYNKSGMVKAMHNQSNAGNFNNSLITSGTNKTLNQLWNECLRAECKGGKAL